MAYEKTVWANGQAPALDAEHLNKIEQGIADAVSVTPQTLSDEQKAQALANINAAPGGFGWGDSAVVPPNNSIDDAKESGLYYCSPNYVGAPSGHTYIGFGTVLSMKRDNNSVIQVYWSEASSNITGTPLNLVRRFDGTKWYPWEYLNPPMLNDVDYPTIERYKGKPVHRGLLNDFEAWGYDNGPGWMSAGKSITYILDAGGTKNISLYGTGSYIFSASDNARAGVAIVQCTNGGINAVTPLVPLGNWKIEAGSGLSVNVTETSGQYDLHFNAMML